MRIVISRSTLSIAGTTMSVSRWCMCGRTQPHCVMRVTRSSGRTAPRMKHAPLSLVMTRMWSEPPRRSKYGQVSRTYLPEAMP